MDKDQTLSESAKELQRVTNEVKNLGEDIQKKYQAGATVTEELKAKADEALTGMNALKAAVTEMEQKLAVRQSGEQIDRRSAGERFVSDESVKEVLALKAKSATKGSIALEVKDKPASPTAPTRLLKVRSNLSQASSLP